MTNGNRIKGLIMVTCGASLWGLSGTVAQHLFQNDNISMPWLVTTRLLISGILLILIASLGSNRRNVWSVWKDSKLVFKLILFGLFGMLGVQFTYFASINEGNAAVATLLQYLAPVFIILFFVFYKKVLPRWLDWIGVSLALIGTFLLLTNGNIEELTVSTPAIVWGILSGVTLAFYTLYSGSLIKELGSTIVVGWGMIIGGICMNFFVHPIWDTNVTSWISLTTVYIAFVVIFGTLIAFYMYLESLKYISPTETSLLGCSEPIAAVISSVVWLNIAFETFQIIGALSILLMIVLISLKKENNNQTQSFSI
ncbi:DMT family transporter [Chengkuizengella sp. SCS-71B]|uniref:DMT family transporter n=1 Tax=Chengkuizengella sp. SCS-71B TaxID=3115290 RepID=UPI0039B74E7C